MFIKDRFLLNILVSRWQIKKDLFDHIPMQIKKIILWIVLTSMKKNKEYYCCGFFICQMGKTPPTLLIHMVSSDSSAQEALQEDHKRWQAPKKGQQHTSKSIHAPLEPGDGRPCKWESKLQLFSVINIRPSKIYSRKMYTSFMKQRWGKVV